MRAYFVIGTDTGVGKTLVTAALLAAARRRGQTALPFKPAETGCSLREGELAPADAEFLARAAGLSEIPASVCPYRLRTPAAPAVAAREEGVAISLERAGDALSELTAPRPDLLLAEGAGGLLVPFTAKATNADLIRHLGLPVLLVARAGLGTINHSLLTIEAARARQLDLRGILFSETESPQSDPTLRSNADEIASRTDVPLLGTLPSIPEPTPEALARAAESHLALDRIL